MDELNFNTTIHECMRKDGKTRYGFIKKSMYVLGFFVGNNTCILLFRVSGVYYISFENDDEVPYEA